jgi:hypothetical protein
MTRAMSPGAGPLPEEGHPGSGAPRFVEGFIGQARTSSQVSGWIGCATMMVWNALTRARRLGARRPPELSRDVVAVGIPDPRKHAVVHCVVRTLSREASITASLFFRISCGGPPGRGARRELLLPHDGLRVEALLGNSSTRSGR